MSKFQTALRLLKENPFLLIAGLGANGLLNWMSDETYLNLVYKGHFGRKMDFNNPVTFNEKLQWLKVYNHNPKLTIYADKYAVREHIANTIGKEYLIPLIGVYDSFDEIDFSALPNQFVLKCTHDSGSVIICKGKSTFDAKMARKKLNRCLNRNIYYPTREWCYKNIKPRIICEQYMVDESGLELKDYKIFNFNGEPQMIQVDYNRFVEHKRNLYTTDWEYIDAAIQYPADPNVMIVKPNKLDEMLECARILSKGIPHVRTDFYSIEDKIYFSEMTFYHGSGYEQFTPEEWDYTLGSWLELPDKKLR